MFWSALLLFVRNQNCCSTSLGWVFCLFSNIMGSKARPWKRVRGKQQGLETRGKEKLLLWKVRCLMVCKQYLHDITKSTPDTHHWGNLSRTYHTTKRFHGHLSELQKTDLTAKPLLELLLFFSTWKKSYKILSASQQYKNVSPFSSKIFC